MSASFPSRACAWLFVFAAAFPALGSPCQALASALPDHQIDQTVPAVRPTEPFGRQTSALAEGPLRAKWRDVERSIETEAKIIAECRANPANCGSRPAIQFLRIVDVAAARSGLARLGEVNRAVNLAIRPVSDQTQYGVDDLWVSPLATLAAGAGDCEDYAIAKFVALHEAGVASQDLRLVIMREILSGEDHAVVAARVDGRWHVLDNRHLAMIEDTEVDKYRPIFAIDAEGAKRFDQPMIATADTVRENQSPRLDVVDASQPDAGLSTSLIAPELSTPADDVLQTQAM